MSRLAFSEPSIGSQTTRHGPPLPKVRSPSSSETSVKSPSSCSSLRTTASFGSRVDRGRVVAAHARLQHRLALDARRQVREHDPDVLDRGPADLQPGRHSGWNRSPEISFGKKYVVFCGSTSPRRA